MPTKNKDIQKKHRDAWYRKNKSKQIARQLERREFLRSLLWRYKRFLKCDVCKLSFRDIPECLDFHHLDPSKKEGSVSSRALYSKQSLKRELKKCIPLCANCHRTLHYQLKINLKQ